MFGGLKDFYPNFPKRPRNILQRKSIPKTRLQCFKWKNFKHHFCQIYPNLPERNQIQTWPKENKNKKETSALLSRVQFLQNQSTYSALAKTFTHLAQISTYFSRIVSDFIRIFNKSTVLGVRLHPYTPASHTSAFDCNKLLVTLLVLYCRREVGW